MAAREINFDGIVGLTHNYAGLSHGNVASTNNKRSSSNPRAAALEGLAKMKFVADLGIQQAVLPPLFRPCLRSLHELGFRGNPEQMITQASQVAPAVLAACFSASSMWTANAATVSPSSDCEDGKVHLTPANLVSMLHRSIEAESTTRNLRAIFGDQRHFQVHNPLSACQTLADEGAANHTRLCQHYDGPAIETFVYGRSALDRTVPSPKKYPARQTLESCQAIARRHQLDPQRTVFIQQNPIAIDAGVFHNDVISVGNRNVLLCHESAFSEQTNVLDDLKKRFQQHCDTELFVIQLSEQELPLEDAVSSYLFNSQLVSKSDGSMSLICPQECETNLSAKACLERIVADSNPIHNVNYMGLRQSMNNGGGPACLRLRVVLSEEQIAQTHQSVFFTEELFQSLSEWVNKHYRDSLSVDDLRDPKLIDEVYTAFQALSEILNLPANILIGE